MMLMMVSGLKFSCIVSGMKIVVMIGMVENDELMFMVISRLISSISMVLIVLLLLIQVIEVLIRFCILLVVFIILVKLVVVIMMKLMVVIIFMFLVNRLLVFFQCIMLDSEKIMKLISVLMIIEFSYSCVMNVVMMDILVIVRFFGLQLILMCLVCLICCKLQMCLWWQLNSIVMSNLVSMFRVGMNMVWVMLILLMLMLLCVMLVSRILLRKMLLKFIGRNMYGVIRLKVMMQVINCWLICSLFSIQSSGGISSGMKVIWIGRIFCEDIVMQSSRLIRIYLNVLVFLFCLLCWLSSVRILLVSVWVMLEWVMVMVKVLSMVYDRVIVVFLLRLLLKVLRVFLRFRLLNSLLIIVLMISVSMICIW